MTVKLDHMLKYDVYSNAIDSGDHPPTVDPWGRGQRSKTLLLQLHQNYLIYECQTWPQPQVWWILVPYWFWWPHNPQLTPRGGVKGQKNLLVQLYQSYLINPCHIWPYAKVWWTLEPYWLWWPLNPYLTPRGGVKGQKFVIAIAPKLFDLRMSNLTTCLSMVDVYSNPIDFGDLSPTVDPWGWGQRSNF